MHFRPRESLAPGAKHRCPTISTDVPDTDTVYHGSLGLSISADIRHDHYCCKFRLFLDFLLEIEPKLAQNKTGTRSIAYPSVSGVLFLPTLRFLSEKGNPSPLSDFLSGKGSAPTHTLFPSTTVVKPISPITPVFCAHIRKTRYYLTRRS